jgi:hypothetical protein
MIPKLIKVLEEIKAEQQISPFFNDDTLTNYIKEAEYDVNHAVGEKIDYESDLEARSLLKNYVLYANHKRLAEFKEYIEVNMQNFKSSITEIPTYLDGYFRLFEIKQTDDHFPIEFISDTEKDDMVSRIVNNR